MSCALVATQSSFRWDEPNGDVLDSPPVCLPPKDARNSSFRRKGNTKNAILCALLVMLCRYQRQDAAATLQRNGMLVDIFCHSVLSRTDVVKSLRVVDAVLLTPLGVTTFHLSP